MMDYGPTTMRQKLARQYGRIRYNAMRRRRERMERGPYLDGPALIVPTDWYNCAAVEFWKSKGFRFRDDGEYKQWMRDTRRTLDGKTYTPTAWLTAARRRYFEFFPMLKEQEVD